MHRPAWAEISASALAHNIAVVRDLLGATQVCAVVKANGYGHGAVLAARAMVAGGADCLAVAIIDEGIELRDAGIDAPILLLSEIPSDTIRAALESDLMLTIGSLEGARAAATAAAELGGVHRVHLKVDTGMLRQGVNPRETLRAARILHDCPALELEGIFTHFSVADGDDDADQAFTARQVDIFNRVRGELRQHGIDPPSVHLANSAGVLGHPASHATLARPGLVLYGYLPAPWLARALAERGASLRPALSLRAQVVATRRGEVGDRPSYGRHRELSAPSTIATVPFGYADGYPRRLFDAGAYVLINGRRYPLAGMVTMDQLLINCGDDEVAVGDDVVLLGVSGDESLSAEDWAEWGQTVTWEVLCGIGARVPRVLVE
ncbi:MAG: alanine racemase [Acidobacteria bacterium]|nr:alanine racemase [Acidobacteriota bacterium]